MYQSIIIVGNLGRDPEMRYTPGGTPVTNMSVAVNRKWTDKEGEKHERTTWFRVTAWRRLAETCNQYLAKGRLVMVVGEMQEPKVWQGQDGEWHSSLNVTARMVKFLGGHKDADSGGKAPDTEASPTAGEEEEIPF